MMGTKKECMYKKIGHQVQIEEGEFPNDKRNEGNPISALAERSSDGRRKRCPRCTTGTGHPGKGSGAGGNGKLWVLGDRKFSQNLHHEFLEQMKNVGGKPIVSKRKTSWQVI